MTHETSSTTPSAPKTTDEIVAAVALAADVDPRSVWKALGGGVVRGRAGLRIARELARIQPTDKEADSAEREPP